MNPHMRNKVDLSSLSQKERDLLIKAGRLAGKPSGDAPHINALRRLNPHQRNERKYFDSGEYALSKAGKASSIGVTEVGHEHPSPEKIPHCAAGPGPTGPSGGTALGGGMSARTGVAGAGGAYASGRAPGSFGHGRSPSVPFNHSNLRPMDPSAAASVAPPAAMPLAFRGGIVPPVGGAGTFQHRLAVGSPRRSQAAPANAVRSAARQSALAVAEAPAAETAPAEAADADNVAANPPDEGKDVDVDVQGNEELAPVRAPASQPGK